MLGNSNEGIFWPATEPVHCAATEQTWELESSAPEFLTNLILNHEGVGKIKVYNHNHDIADALLFAPKLDQAYALEIIFFKTYWREAEYNMKILSGSS